ncbi:MAG: hydrogenase maturation protease [Verrucomicrobia bacterium]|nr:hydrogenase maturation protease [Verrucomicrobiota bacterium]
MPLLVLGLGNDILTDDAVGLHAARHLARHFDGSHEVHVLETMEMGLALLDFMAGYRNVILVDAIQTGTAPPGTVHEIDPDTVPRLAGRTPHFLGVGETLALGRLLGLPMPERVRIFAVEVADPFTLGTQMTEPLQRALPAVIAAVTAAALEMRSASPPSPRAELAAP